MNQRKLVRIQEAARITGIEEQIITAWIEREWIIPAETGTEELDEEDVARAQLIKDLLTELEVNDNAVPVILHLIDQIHNLHHQIRRLGMK